MSDDTLSLLPSSYILADDVDLVSNFLMSIFDINDNTNTNTNSSISSGQTSPTNNNLSMKYDYRDKQDKVMKYNSIRISDKNTIIIIQKSSVSDTLLSVVRSVSVRQIFVTCKDPGIFVSLSSQSSSRSSSQSSSSLLLINIYSHCPKASN